MADKVLIDLEKLPDKTESGILLPETRQQDVPNTGIVFMVGIDVKYLEIGDRVYFTKFAGTEIVYNKKPYLVIREGDVIIRDSPDPVLEVAKDLK